MIYLSYKYEYHMIIGIFYCRGFESGGRASQGAAKRFRGGSETVRDKDVNEGFK